MWNSTHNPWRKWEWSTDQSQPEVSETVWREQTTITQVSKINSNLELNICPRGLICRDPISGPNLSRIVVTPKSRCIWTSGSSWPAEYRSCCCCRSGGLSRSQCQIVKFFASLTESSIKWYFQDGHEQPKRLSFQIHGQEGPNSYRFGYDTGLGWEKYSSDYNYSSVVRTWLRILFWGIVAWKGLVGWCTNWKLLSNWQLGWIQVWKLWTMSNLPSTGSKWFRSDNCFFFRQSLWLL